MEGCGGVAEADTGHLLSAFVRYKGTEHTPNKRRRQAYRGNSVSPLSNGSLTRHIGFMSAQLQELRAVLAGRYGVERELGQGQGGMFPDRSQYFGTRPHHGHVCVDDRKDGLDDRPGIRRTESH